MLEWALLGLLLLRGQRDAAAVRSPITRQVTAKSGVKYAVTLVRSFQNGQNEFSVARLNGPALISYRQNANGSRSLLAVPGGPNTAAVQQARRDFGV